MKLLNWIRLSLLCLTVFFQTSCAGILVPTHGSIRHIIWSQEQKNFYFSYQYLRKYSSGISSAQLTNKLTNSLYNFSFEKNLFESVYEAQSALPSSDPFLLFDLLGFYENKIMLKAENALYSLDPVSKKYQLFYEFKDLKVESLSFLKSGWCWIQYTKKGDPNTFRGFLHLSAPQQIYNQSLETASKKYSKSPQIFSISPSGEHVAYSVLLDNVSQISEFGIAKFDENTKQFLHHSTFKVNQNPESPIGFQILYWDSPQSFIYRETSRVSAQTDAKPLIKVMRFNFESKSTEILTEPLLQEHSQFFPSPDFKRLVFIKDDEILSANMDFTNQKTMLKINRDLPQSEKNDFYIISLTK